MAEVGPDQEVPRGPTWDWEAHLVTKKVAYTGEVLDVARRLTLRQALPGLPPRAEVGP